MRLRTVVLALALACGLTTVAEAKKSKVFYPGIGKKTKQNHKRPVFKPGKANARHGGKRPKVPHVKHR
jgi:hypothetical protein